MKLRSGTIVGYRPPIELNKRSKLQTKEPQGIKTTAIKQDLFSTKEVSVKLDTRDYYYDSRSIITKLSIASHIGFTLMEQYCLPL